jgi:hypothetical protein
LILVVRELREHLLTFVLVSLILVPQPVASNEIGLVDRAVGWRQIVRDKQELEPEKGSDIISKDDLRTGEGRMQVRFVDDSKLRMTEHTRIVIDNVVFDDDPKKSDLAMTFAQGTARFVTGKLGTIDKENIKLRTPTAAIGIRGTDFTVTVDEFGRTLVILLPDVNGISSGEIIVSTMAGDVVLNKPFQSTTTSVLEMPPSNPAILNLTLDMLNNILIINPPKERQTVDEFYSDINSANKNPLDIDFLDEELLQDELDREGDQLEFTELDINFLDVELLENLLDSYSDLDAEFLKEEQATGEVDIQGTSEGFDTVTQVVTVVDGEKIALSRQVSATVQITVDKEEQTTIVIEQDGKLLDPIVVNNGDTNTINISQ